LSIAFVFRLVAVILPCALAPLPVLLRPVLVQDRLSIQHFVKASHESDWLGAFVKFVVFLREERDN
jgi:hypothetical protein